MSDIINQPADYTYPVVISCLSTLVELIGFKGIIDVISSPVKNRMIYFINLVVMISTLIQGICQHMTIANTMPIVYCNPVNVFSNAFWHIQFTLAEARWLYQAYVFVISKQHLRVFQQYFFSLLIIGRAGVGIWDVISSGGIFDPELGCIYYQYPPSGVAYFSYDILNVLISTVASISQLYSLLKEMGGSEVSNNLPSQSPGTDGSHSINLDNSQKQPRATVTKKTPAKPKSVFGALIESSVVRSVSFCCFLIPTFILILTDPAAPFLQYSFLIEIGLVSLLTFYEKTLLRFLMNPFKARQSAT